MLSINPIGIEVKKPNGNACHSLKRSSYLTSITGQRVHCASLITTSITSNMNKIFIINELTSRNNYIELKCWRSYPINISDSDIRRMAQRVTGKCHCTCGRKETSVCNRRLERHKCTLVQVFDVSVKRRQEIFIFEAQTATRACTSKSLILCRFHQNHLCQSIK